MSVVRLASRDSQRGRNGGNTVAKEYTVELGGKPRKLRFTQADARALYQQFQKPLHDLFFDDVLGMKDGVLARATNPVAVHTALLAALRHDAVALTAEMLDGWVEKFITDGGSIATLALELMKTATQAGLTNGTSFDFEEFVKRHADDLGKAPETTPDESPAVN